MPSLLTTRHGVRSTAAALLCACGALLSACGEQHAGRRAVERARVDLEVLSAGGQAANPFPAKRRDDLAKLAASLEPHSADSNQAVAQSVAVLLSRARAELAAISLAGADAHERQLDSVLGRAQDLLDTWQRQHALADASVVDPAEPMALLRQRLGELAEELDSATRAERAASAEAEALTEQAASLLARAKSLAEQATAQRARIETVSATEGLEIATAAAALDRQAAALDVSATEMLAKAEAQRGLVARASRDAEGTRRRAASVETSVTQLASRVQAGAAAAQASRALAERAGAELAERLAEAAALLSGPHKEATDDAARLARQAQTDLRGAGTPSGSDRATIALARGTAQQSLGEALLNRARSLQRLQRALGAAAQAQPPLPGSEQHAAQLTAIKQESAAALAEAKQAFQDAREDYQSVSGQPRAAQQAERLDRVLAGLSGGSVSGATGPDGGATDGEPGGAAGGEPALAQVRDQIASALALIVDGKLSPLAELISERDDTSRRLRAILFKFEDSGTKLDSALRAKLGTSFEALLREQAQANADQLSGLGAAAGGVPFSVDAPPTASEARQEILKQLAQQGALAPDGSVVFDDGTVALTFRQTDGVWRFDLPEVPAEFAPVVAQVLTTLEQAGQFMDALTEDINSGLLRSKDEFVAAVIQRGRPLALGLLPALGPLMGAGLGGDGTFEVVPADGSDDMPFPPGLGLPPRLELPEDPPGGAEPGPEKPF